MIPMNCTGDVGGGSSVAQSGCFSFSGVGEAGAWLSSRRVSGRAEVVSIADSWSREVGGAEVGEAGGGGCSNESGVTAIPRRSKVRTQRMPSEVTKLLNKRSRGQYHYTQKTSNQLETKALQLRDSGISVHNVQDIHSAQPIKNFTTMDQHYSMALSDSSPLQTCLEEARIASAEMPTATVSGQWTCVLVHEQATARLM